MSDDEGSSRREFLRLLAEMGEEPAFIARGIAPQVALESLLRECSARREEMLKGPYRHLAILAHRVDGNWSRLAPLLAGPEAVAELEALHAHMPARRSPRSAWLGTEERCLSQFLESAARFNRAWRTYLTGIDYDAVNKPRREYNQYYPVEKACAFDHDPASVVFEPLVLIDVEFLERRFPYLSIPQPAGCPD